MINDYFKLRVELGLAQFPDDMVHETGDEIERLMLMRQPVSATQLAWFIESVARQEPRVVGKTMSEQLRARDSSA